MNEFADFCSQHTILEELVHSRGHICLYLPKYHCELNPIERNWCHAKKISRQYVDGTIVKLRKVVPTSLETATVEMLNKFFRTCCDGLLKQLQRKRSGSTSQIVQVTPYSVLCKQLISTMCTTCMYIHNC